METHDKDGAPAAGPARYTGADDDSSRPGGAVAPGRQARVAVIAVIVIALLAVMIVLHVTGVVGAGTNG